MHALSVDQSHSIYVLIWLHQHISQVQDTKSRYLDSILSRHGMAQENRSTVERSVIITSWGIQRPVATEHDKQTTTWRPLDTT